jgi:hypothetical protein
MDTASRGCEFLGSRADKLTPERRQELTELGMRW